MLKLNDPYFDSLLKKKNNKNKKKNKTKQNKTKQHTLTHTRCNAMQKFPINCLSILYCSWLNIFTNNVVFS